MATKSKANEVMQYFYDKENRLTDVKKNTTLIAQYLYDGDGGRVQKTSYITTLNQTAGGLSYGSLLGTPQLTSTPVITKYVGEMYEESAGVGTRFIFLGGQRVAAVDTASGSALYYHGDHLGSTNVMTDSNGVQAELLEYDPYGKIQRHDGGNASSRLAKQQFTGKKLDDETGLIYFGARYYDPSLGRFITPDTIVQNPSDPQTLNRYSYCGNNPINRIDPTGHKWSWKKFWKSFAGAFVGAIVTVLTGGLGAPIAFALGGMVGGAITGGLEGGWRGALMGGLMGGIMGGAVGAGIGAFGAGFGYAALAAGGAYSIATGRADSFIGGVAGGILGSAVGNGIQSYNEDGISVKTPKGQSADPMNNKNWDVLGIGTTDPKAAAFANKNGSAVFYTRSRGYLSDFVRAGMQKVFGNSLASRQFGGYLRGADGFYIAAHSEGTLTMAGAIKGLAVDGVKLLHAQLTFNGPVIMQSTANNLAASIGAPTPRYNLNFGDPIGVFATPNPVRIGLYGIIGVPTLATFHGTNHYPDMNVGVQR